MLIKEESVCLAFCKPNLIKMTLFEELEQLVTEARKDADAFYSKGNKAAGTRLRKAMQEAKNKAQEIRKEVTEKKNVE